jgi:hypothetical protein
MDLDLMDAITQTTTGMLGAPPPAAKAAPAPVADAPASVPKTPDAPASPKTSDALGLRDIPDALRSGTPPKSDTPAGDPPPAAPDAASKQDNMAAMRKRVEDQQRIIDELTQLKKQVFDDSGKPKVPDEFQQVLKAREAEIQRLSDELGRENFAKSPQFLREYQEPINRSFARLAATVKELGGDEKLAENMVGMGIKQRMQYLQQHMPEAAAVLMPMFSRIDEQLYNRNAALEQHKTLSHQLVERETAQQQDQIRQVRSAMRDKALTTLESEGHFLFSKVPGNDAWNSKVDQFRGAVDVLINSNNPELQTEALALSVAAPIYRSLYEESTARVQELEAELGRIRKATPSIGSNTRSNPAGTALGSRNISPEDAANAVLEGLFNR